jgi:hypothetical protein
MKFPATDCDRADGEAKYLRSKGYQPAGGEAKDATGAG